MLNLLKTLLKGAVSFFQVRATSKAEERRRLIRLRCNYEVQCVFEETQFTANILDMGLNGMRLRMQERIKPGSTVFVYHPAQVDRTENEYVLCLVRWSRKRRDSEEIEAGLQYADTPGNMRRSWVKFLLKELGFDERAIYTRRKLIRAKSLLTAVLFSTVDGHKLEGKVLNLGVGGALFESSTTYPPKTQVRLRIPAWGKLKPLDLPGVVLHSKRPNPSGNYLTSVRFEDLRSPQLKLLGQYVLQLLKETTD